MSSVAVWMGLKAACGFLGGGGGEVSQKIVSDVLGPLRYFIHEALYMTSEQLVNYN